MDIKILIVDESTTISKIVAAAFESKNATVESVANGKDALGKMKLTEPDIVIADADMQDLSGYDLSRQIKEIDQFSDTPVLLLVGSSNALDKEKFRNSKAEGYLAKPFKSDDLMTNVYKLLKIEEMKFGKP